MLSRLQRSSSVRSCTCFFFSSRRRHTRLQGDWSSDVCSSDLGDARAQLGNRTAVLLRRITQDFPHLLFHAAPVALSAALQTYLDVFLQLTNDKLGHAALLIF